MCTEGLSCLSSPGRSVGVGGDGGRGDGFRLILLLEAMPLLDTFVLGSALIWF